MNRITDSIARVKDQIASADADKVAALDKSFGTLDFAEVHAYQNAQTRAHASGLLNTDEAMTVYQVINTWNTATLAARVTVTKLMGELITA